MVRRIGGPSLAGTLVTLSTAVFASASHEPARLGLTPVDHDGTYFVLTLDPGEKRHLRVEAANFGHEEAVARTYASDVYTIVNGGFGADLFGERPSGPTLWLTYPTQEMTLNPDDALVIDFDVTVPDDTPPGEYVTALVIENAEPLRGSGAIAVDQINRSAIAVAIQIPGAENAELSIGEVTYQEVAGLPVVSFEVTNPGNVHLRPSGRFELRDGDGTELTAASVVMESVYAGTSTTLEAPVVEALAAGDYCAELSLTDEETGATDSTDCLPFTIAAPPDDGSPLSGPPGVAEVVDALSGWPPGLPLASLLLVGLGGLLFVLARRRRRPTAFAGAPADWPVTDLQPRGTSFEDALPAIIGSLRRILHEHPEVSRGWIVERGSGFLLAVEVRAEATPAQASKLSALLQERADREVARIMPLQVVCLKGAGPVARMTSGTVPFYVRAGQA